jgi:hypothetical protein
MQTKGRQRKKQRNKREEDWCKGEREEQMKKKYRKRKFKDYVLSSTMNYT